MRATTPLTGKTAQFSDFWRERHLAAMSTVRPDGTPHVVPVGVTLDFAAATAWVISSAGSHRARLLAQAPQGLAAAVCQIDGRRWSTLSGRVYLLDDPATIREAELRYAKRYRPPRVNPQRIVLELRIHEVLGSV